MEILFRDDVLRDICNHDGKLRRRFGVRTARKVRVRLDDLRAATTLDVMRTLGGRCEELSGNLKGRLSLRLDKRMRMVFEPAGAEDIRKPDGGLDWRKVTAVRIVSIEDYHG